MALASHLESVVRVNGGVPATVGILNGVARIGFKPEELIELAASAGKPDTKKISRKDLSYVCGLVCPSISLLLYTLVDNPMLIHFRASLVEGSMVALQSLEPWR